MRVRIPGPLRSYTAGEAVVTAQGHHLADVVADLDTQFPGLRFRIIDEQGNVRRHIRFFVNADAVADLTPSVRDTDEVMIVCALSGG